DLVVSPIVVADLTDKNANVLWELGVRQSFKHGTITIVEGKLELPFDISVKGTLDYNTKDHFKMAEFRKQLKKALNDCLSFPDRPDSQVLETLSGRGTLFEIFHRDEAIRRADAIISECNRNLKFLQHIIETAKKNQENPRKRIFPITRLSSVAIELLITNRYVDEKQSFYTTAESCLDIIETINDRLRSWGDSPDSMENWLLKYEKTIIKTINALKNNVETARDKLRKLF
ncbi:MAG: hypothetical protein WC568_11750, partial [Candidatus Methanoperedens sp.]